jgi:hypothetical protein
MSAFTDSCSEPEKRGVTFASLGASFGSTAIDSRHTIIKISFGIVINDPLV